MNKGWIRLLSVFSLFWFVVSVGTVIYEKESINPFDQFDEPPPSYIFFSWSGRNLFAEKRESRELYASQIKIGAFVFLPVLLFWVLLSSFVWIANGFKVSKT